jgi:hypothetical protein
VYLGRLASQFSDIAAPLEQASATVKTQPWRLIWPSTKRYEPAPRASTPTPRPKVKKSRN